MPLRRDFLKTCAGTLGGFVSLGSARIAAGQAADIVKPPKPVVVGGRRVKTIDMHAHYLVRDVWELVKDTNMAPALKTLLEPTNYMHVPVGDERLQKMDAEQIDVQVL